MHAPIRGVKGHSQLSSRVLRTVSVCMLDLRHIYNVANLTNLQIMMSKLFQLDFMIKTNDKKLRRFDLPEVIFKCELKCASKLA